MVTLPGEMQAVAHDEGRISLLHQWIEKLCDPYSRLINELNKTVNVSSHFLVEILLTIMCPDMSASKIDQL